MESSHKNICNQIRTHLDDVGIRGFPVNLDLLMVNIILLYNLSTQKSIPEIMEVFFDRVNHSEMHSMTL